MDYYVLGKKDNIMLKKYQDMYYEKILSMISDLQENDILKEEFSNLLKIDNKSFVMNADQSSILNLLHINIISFGKPKRLYLSEISKLKKELDLFLDGKTEDLIMNKGKKIGDTNIKLTLYDNNPLNKVSAHPDHNEKNGGIMGWGKKTEKEWLTVYEKTFDLLKKVDSDIYDELNQIITKIIPIGTSENMHNSASYKESVGHLYMGYTINSSKPEVYNLEAIIHESSHNKLNLLMQFDPLVLNGKDEKYYSAIRPDARHIHGVLLGAHAFVPTMYILMKSYKEKYLGNDKIFLEKIILYYIKTKFLCKVLKKYAIFTDLGKKVFDEIKYVSLLMDKIFKEIKPPMELVLKAKNIQKQHFKNVNSNYPYLEY